MRILLERSEYSKKEKQIIEKIGHRLLHLRTHHRFSQGELAKKIGCNQRYISEWEGGIRFIPTRYLYRLCETFELPLEYFDPRKPGVEEIFQQETSNA